MQQRLAGGGVKKRPSVQGIPDHLIVDAQVKAAGIKAGVAQDGQPGEGDDVEQDKSPGEEVREPRKLEGTEGKRPEFEPGGGFEGIYAVFG